MTATDIGEQSGCQGHDWPLWEVFVRAKGGLSHRHVGSVHAPDAELALRHARDTYTRRLEGVSLWVVPSADDRRVAIRPRRAAVRAGRGQDLPPPDLLRHSRRSEAHLMPSLPAIEKDVEKRAAKRAAIMARSMRRRRASRIRRWFDYLLAAGRRCADPRPAARRMVRACAGAGGRSQPRQSRARPDRAGDATSSALGRAMRDRARPSTATCSTARIACWSSSPMAISRRPSPGSCCSRPGSTCSTSGWPNRPTTALAAIAAKAVKEVAYHRELAADWTVRLGDGTEESARRMADGLDWCWRFIPELFEVDEVLEELIERGIAADPREFEDEYRAAIGARAGGSEAGGAGRPAADPRRAARASQRASRPFAGGDAVSAAHLSRRDLVGMAEHFYTLTGRRDRARDRRGQFDPLRRAAGACATLSRSRPGSI